MSGSWHNVVDTIEEILLSDVDLAYLPTLRTAYTESLAEGEVRTAFRCCALAIKLLLDYGQASDARRVADQGLHLVDDAGIADLRTDFIADALDSHRLCNDETTARRLFLSECRRVRVSGNTEAELRLAARYARSLDNRWGPEKALKWHRRAASLSLLHLDASPTLRCSALTRFAHALFELGRYREAFRSLNPAEQIRESHEVDPLVARFTYTVGRNICRETGDDLFAAIQGSYELAIPLMSSRPVDTSMMWVTKGDQYCLEEEPPTQEQDDCFDRGVRYALMTCDYLQQATALTYRGLSHLSRDRISAGLKDLEHAARIMAYTASSIRQLCARLILADFAEQMGDRRRFDDNLSYATALAPNIRHAGILAWHASLSTVPSQWRARPWEQLSAFRRSMPRILGALCAGYYPTPAAALITKRYWPFFEKPLDIIRAMNPPNDILGWRHAPYFLDARAALGLRAAFLLSSIFQQSAESTEPWGPNQALQQVISTDVSLPVGVNPVSIRGAYQDDFDYDRVLDDVIDSGLYASPRELSPNQVLAVPPVGLDDLPRLIDNDTVVLLAVYQREEILLLPLRCRYDGSPTICTQDGRPLVIPDGIAAVESFESAVLNEHCSDICDWLDDSSYHDSGLISRWDWTSALSRGLSDDFLLPSLLEDIEPDAAARRDLHLIIVPDNRLSHLPLHSALLADGTYLYESVASIQYSQSLSTLRSLQLIDQLQQEQERRSRDIRGVLFACPATKVTEDTVRQLSGVAEEVNAILNETGNNRWRVYFDSPEYLEPPTVRQFFNHHNLGNLLVLSGHGCAHRSAGVTSTGNKWHRHASAFRMAEGFLTHHHLQRWPFDFRKVELTFFNACVSGRGFKVGDFESDGFLTALAMAGCRRTISALWELSDQAAPYFSGCLMRALNEHVFGTKERTQHSFAIALKSAVTEFRQIEDRRFDHQFFWAPYVLTGLG